MLGQGWGRDRAFPFKHLKKKKKKCREAYITEIYVISILV